MWDQGKLHAEAKSTLLKAKSIFDRADAQRRDLTDAERAEVAGYVATAKDLQRQTEKVVADAGMRDKLAALDGYGPLAGMYGGGHKAGASSWATEVAEKLTKTAQSHGMKSITTGGIDVPSVVEVVTQIPSLPTRLLDLVPTKPLTGNVFSYPRQTVRTNNAAPVADNATKPTSVYTFEDVEERARVVAHLSEAIPLRYFEDHADLEVVLDDQMRVDLLRKLEAQIASGDGTGESFTGLFATSGVLARSWSVDLLTTLRRARTSLEAVGEEPTAWVFNPVDVETLDLATDDNNRFYGQEVANLLGNLPRVASSAVPAGTGLLGDFRQVRLYVRQDATLDVDRSGDLFSKNQCRLRMEGRFGFGVLRPQAFCVVDLSA